MPARVALLALALLTTPAQDRPSTYAAPAAERWELTNGVVRAIYTLNSQGIFSLQELSGGGVRWSTPESAPSSPIHIQMGDRLYSAHTAYRKQQAYFEDFPGGRRLAVDLTDSTSSAAFHLAFEVFDGEAVIRQQITIRNLGGGPVHVTDADFLRYRFSVPGDVLDVFHIDQWDPTTTTSFQLHRQNLPPEGGVIALRTGADARDIAWYAFRDAEQRGLFAGLEFNGRAQVSLLRQPADGSLTISALIPGLYREVAPGKTFALPPAFLGVFAGDWDEAGHLTQRFAEKHIAQPAPADFPWVSWDSWGYGTSIDEQILWDNADAAAKLGVELFVVDLGWARHIGEWRAHPERFPRGMRALSDHVHQLGMKFGLHFAPAEAAPESAVLQEHPEWTSSETDWYFGAVSLCLGHDPVRKWIVQEAVNMIDGYNADYIVQDGENMVKRCRRSDHTHHALDSNYANSTDGIDWVVREVQRLRPHVLWENCEDGGHMMTFQMQRLYVTSISNDGTGALDARKGVWGATYPFLPRYNSRYMPENPTSTLITRSNLFGGPWHFMNRLAAMSPDEAQFAAREIGLYKRVRPILNGARVYHLLGDPGSYKTDAIEGYNARLDTAVIVASRDGSPEDRVLLRPQGLRPEGIYTVRFEDSPRQEILSGRQLAEAGVTVTFPALQSAEVVFIEPR